MRNPFPAGSCDPNYPLIALIGTDQSLWQAIGLWFEDPGCFLRHHSVYGRADSDIRVPPRLKYIVLTQPPESIADNPENELPDDSR